MKAVIKFTSLYLFLIILLFPYCSEAARGTDIPSISPTGKKVKYHGVKKQFTNSIGMTFVFIQPGTFMMGSREDEPKRDSDEKRHKVTLTKGFYIGATEVTQAQWRKIMENNPSHFNGANRPVEKVSWNNCQEFIWKLNLKEETDKYRLPTEAEWEYACRAGTTTPFYTGGCISTDQANYDGNYPMDSCSRGKYRWKTIEVASFAPNPWGLYDMHRDHAQSAK